MIKKLDSKQRLFEVMSKLDKTFKPKLNEDYVMNNPQTQYKLSALKMPEAREVTFIVDAASDEEALAMAKAQYADEVSKGMNLGKAILFKGNTNLGQVNEYFGKKRSFGSTEPKMVTLKYPATCEETGKEMQVGDQALYYPIGKHIFSPDSKQAQEYREMKDDDVMSGTNYMQEADKSSYSDALVNDIKVLLGNNTALSPRDIQQLSTDHQISPEEVQQTVDYVTSTKQGEQQPLPTNSQEAEEVNDFFKFLKNNPQTGSIASLWYTSTLDAYLAKKASNPMVGRFLKLTKYNFEWARTYGKEVEKVNPDWQIQQRKGDYTEVEGFSVVKRDKRGDEVIDIIPRTPKSIVLVLDEAGNVADTLKTGELGGKYAQFFMPSFFAPSAPSGSGVDFRSLKLYATKRLAAGGKEWINPKFKYEKYSEYFNQIPKGEE